MDCLFEGTRVLDRGHLARILAGKGYESLLGSSALQSINDPWINADFGINSELGNFFFSVYSECLIFHLHTKDLAQGSGFSYGDVRMFTG
jgi:hypothetical protein